jgi:hypothetical protein
MPLARGKGTGQPGRLHHKMPPSARDRRPNLAVLRNRAPKHTRRRVIAAASSIAVGGAIFYAQ